MKKILMLLLNGLAKDKNFNYNVDLIENLWDKYPHASIDLLNKSEGYSENSFYSMLGCGRILKTDNKLIEDSLKPSLMKENINFIYMIDYLKNNNKPLHMVVDSNNKDIALKIIDLLDDYNINKVYIHYVALKGKTVYNDVNEINNKLKTYNMNLVVSISGANFVYDQKQNWKYVKLFTDMLTIGKASKVKKIKETISICYEKGLSDNDIPPIILQDVFINDGDALLWLDLNHLSSEVLDVLTNVNFREYNTINYQKLKTFTLLPEKSAHNSKNILEIPSINNCLGEYLSNLGLVQSRISSLSSYLKLNYFFDGKQDIKLENNTKVKVDNADLEEEIIQISKYILKHINSDDDFILAQLNMSKNNHVLEECLSAICEEVENNFYTLVILGNYYDKNVSVNVPLIVLDSKVTLKNGSITSVIPSILNYMDIKIPEEMKDNDIIIHDK